MPTVIKAPWRARTVNAGTAPEMLSELTKAEGDDVVTVRHEILPHRRGKELGQPADASITLPNPDWIGRLKSRAMSF